MSRTKSRLTMFLLVFALLLVPFTAGAQSAQPNTLPDGATYLIEVPANWNGTLLLYSHGYVTPGSPNPATDVGDPATRTALLASGFALAGSSYAHTGWAIQEALLDQIAVLDIFNATVGKPDRTIAWGHSLGGIITAGLIQRNPSRFDAALPMCGVLSGGVATWNQALDSAFAFKTLLAFGSPLQVTNITNPGANFLLSESLLQTAITTPQGRARAALSFALGDTPDWFTPLSPEPAATDFAGQFANQVLWAAKVDFPFIFALRAELEARAGGNPSWNTGVDYRKQFEKSTSKAEVMALYAAAGLSLEDDLNSLNNAARISANPASVDYLEQNIIFNGDIHIPVLTMHTEGDGLVSNQNEDAYRDTVRQAGNNRLLRETFVHRAGHCAFTPAETVTALTNLISRLDTGKWPDLHPATLNAEAAALGAGLNIFAVSTQTGVQIIPTAPAFDPFQPTEFLREFDASIDARCERHGRNEQLCNVN
ncbi:MAG TPA: prolyl oligopeptidase family serine peptidase [Candidatus Angelobacter sp.]|nr:prolyl oligopeptidase family serine peptidase [Candidatus Angelobacter sp.]